MCQYKLRKLYQSRYFYPFLTTGTDTRAEANYSQSGTGNVTFSVKTEEWMCGNNYLNTLSQFLLGLTTVEDYLVQFFLQIAAVGLRSAALANRERLTDRIHSDWTSSHAPTSWLDKMTVSHAPVDGWRLVCVMESVTKDITSDSTPSE